MQSTGDLEGGVTWSFTYLLYATRKKCSTGLYTFVNLYEKITSCNTTVSVTSVPSVSSISMYQKTPSIHTARSVTSISIQYVSEDPVYPHSNPCQTRYTRRTYKGAVLTRTTKPRQGIHGVHIRELCSPEPPSQDTGHQAPDRLVGQVVKASASRTEDPGFESRLERGFSEIESYQ